jgi:hypothetical protein
MNSVDALQASLKNARETFLNMLDSIVILDIGVIDEIKENGRAHITSSTFIKNNPIVYEDAEIIYPGNVNGCYATVCAGTACLIFIPKSCMPDTTNLKLFVGATSYNRDGVKAMPIGNGTNNTVQTTFGVGGLYSITGQTYTVQFTGNDVTFQRSDGHTTLSIDCEGQVYLSYQTNNGTYLVNIEDGCISSSWLSKEKDVKWIDTLNSDGSRSFTQINPQQQSDNVLFSFSIAADGTVSFTMAQGLTLETKGDLVLRGANVTIDSTADNSTVNINNGNAVVDK